MEDELGGLLFSRERNNTHLTELGRLLEPHLSEVLERTKVAKETASRFLRLDSAQLRLGVMCTIIGPVRFVSFLSRFQGRQSRRGDHPGRGGTRQVVRTAAEGRTGRGAAGGTGGVQPCRCSRSRSIASASSSPARPATRSRARTSYASPILTGSRTWRASTANIPMPCAMSATPTDRLRHYIRSEREDWILTMVAAGMGICFLPESRRRSPASSAVGWWDPEVAREVSLVTVAGRRWSSPVSAFIRAVKQYRWPQGRDGADTPALETAAA